MTGYNLVRFIPANELVGTPLVDRIGDCGWSATSTDEG